MTATEKMIATGKAMGVAVVVRLPVGTPAEEVARIEALGAEVVLGPPFTEAFFRPGVRPKPSGKP